jgi:proteasome lid subunit RPN8/RPN11
LETVAITQQVRAAIVAHALQARPAECCGLLSGDGQLITSLYPLRNEADHPETRYFASPEDLLSAIRKIRQSGQTMMGIYHSHPQSPAYPSKSDVDLAFYSESIYFIVSLERQSLQSQFPVGQSRAEQLLDGQPLPENFQAVPPLAEPAAPEQPDQRQSSDTQSPDSGFDLRAFRIRAGEISSVAIVIAEYKPAPIRGGPGED